MIVSDKKMLQWRRKMLYYFLPAISISAGLIEAIINAVATMLAYSTPENVGNAVPVWANKYLPWVLFCVPYITAIGGIILISTKIKKKMELSIKMTWLMCIISVLCQLIPEFFLFGR